MDNVELTVRGDKLTITVDLSKKGSPSKTGKTRLIGTTHGAAPIDHPTYKGVKVALNVMGPM